MTELSPAQYAKICFLVLMDNYKTKDIRYIDEKLAMLNDGLNAFAWLDRYNMSRVVEYLNMWKYAVPEIWKNEVRLQWQAGLDFGPD